jgi:hypothetical protein
MQCNNLSFRYLQSINVFRAMTIIGTAIIFIGLLIRPNGKKKENHDKNIRY